MNTHIFPQKHCSPEDQARAVRRVLEGETSAAVAQELGVSPERVAAWRDRALDNLEAVFAASAAVIRELRRSESLYRGVVETQTDLICRFTPEGALTFVNSAFRRFYEQPQETTPGRRFTDLLLPEEREYIADAIYSLTPEHPLAVTEPRHVRLDGETRWVRYETRALFDAKGRVREFQSVGRDVTARKLESPSPNPKRLPCAGQ